MFPLNRTSILTLSAFLCLIISWVSARPVSRLHNFYNQRTIQKPDGRPWIPRFWNPWSDETQNWKTKAAMLSNQKPWALHGGSYRPNGGSSNLPNLRNKEFFLEFLPKVVTNFSGSDSFVQESSVGGFSGAPEVTDSHHGVTEMSDKLGIIKDVTEKQILGSEGLEN